MAKRKPAGGQKDGGQHSTTAQRKRMVAEMFRKSAAAIQRVRGDGYTRESDLDGRRLQRRMKAVLSAMDRAVADFHPRYTDIDSIEEALTKLESKPLGSYDDENYFNNLYLAAALWILDDLKKNGKIGEMYRHLPTDFETVVDVDIPIDFQDPSYEQDLIICLMFVLSHRNGTPENARKAFVTERVGRKSQWREHFDAIMGLLNKDRVELACQHFKEKQWDFLDRYFKCVNDYTRQEKQILREMETLAQDEIPTLSAPFAKTTHPGMELGHLFGPNLDRARELSAKLDAVLFQTGNLAFTAGSCCTDTYNSVLRDSKSRLVAETMTSFQIDDPYEICFALLCLIDREDDSPWLYNSSLTVVRAACDMLPWSRGECNEDGDMDFAFHRNNWLEGDNTDQLDLYSMKFSGDDFGVEEAPRMNLAQLIYRLSGSVVPRNMHPFRAEWEKYGKSEEITQAIDLAEILFLSSFQSQAANLRNIDGWVNRWIPDVEEEETIEEPKEIVQKPLAGYWGAVAETIGQSVSREVEEVPTGESPASMREENRLLQQEVKRLKKALYEAGKTVSDEKKRIEQERLAAEQEHRELADLRELVFNQQENMYEDATVVENIRFPCETKHRIVVFGGHESWAREIKPKLPDVRFVDREALPNAEMIRKADVVWIQTNALAHKHFYKIIDVVRKYNIPLRYFTYASAAKCAEQLVLEDKKN